MSWPSNAIPGGRAQNSNWFSQKFRNNSEEFRQNLEEFRQERRSLKEI
jgi:hypothetical protein